MAIAFKELSSSPVQQADFSAAKTPLPMHSPDARKKAWDTRGRIKDRVAGYAGSILTNIEIAQELGLDSANQVKNAKQELRTRDGIDFYKSDDQRKAVLSRRNLGKPAPRKGFISEGQTIKRQLRTWKKRELTYDEDLQVDMVVVARKIPIVYDQPEVSDVLVEFGMKLPVERRNKIFVETYFGAEISRGVPKDQREEGIELSRRAVVDLYARTDPEVFERVRNHIIAIDHYVLEQRRRKVEDLVREHGKFMFGTAYRWLKNADEALSAVQNAAKDMLLNVKFVKADATEERERVGRTVENAVRDILAQRVDKRRRPLYFSMERVEEPEEDDSDFLPNSGWSLMSPNLTISELTHSDESVERLEQAVNDWAVRYGFAKQDTQEVVSQAEAVLGESLSGERFRMTPDGMKAYPLVDGGIDTAREALKRKTSRERIKKDLFIAKAS